MKQLLAGVVVGVIALAAVRFVFVPVERTTHYHANFAVFVEGRRLDLSGDRFVEELGACKVSGLVLPSSRAHLHNHNPDVVHVHHDGVTWGHLLANLGFGLGDRYLALSDGKVLEGGNGKTLKFVLNGREQSSVANELIRSGDRLLISYGPESAAAVAQTQFPAVASTAEEFNRKNDPAGCSGPSNPTLWDRVRHAFVG